MRCSQILTLSIYRIKVDLVLIELIDTSFNDGVLRSSMKVYKAYR